MLTVLKIRPYLVCFVFVVISSAFHLFYYGFKFLPILVVFFGLVLSIFVFSYAKSDFEIDISKGNNKPVLIPVLSSALFFVISLLVFYNYLGVGESFKTSGPYVSTASELSLIGDFLNNFNIGVMIFFFVILNAVIFYFKETHE